MVVMKMFNKMSTLSSYNSFVFAYCRLKIDVCSLFSLQRYEKKLCNLYNPFSLSSMFGFVFSCCRCLLVEPIVICMHCVNSKHIAQRSD